MDPSAGGNQPAAAVRRGDGQGWPARPSAAIALREPDLTVREVQPTSSLHQRQQIRMTRRSLGKIGDASLDLTAGGGPGLRLVQTAAPMAFPFGAQTRTVDESGRLKLHTQPALAEVLAWQDGSLDAVIVEGWLVLRQPGHLIGARAARFSSAARYARSAAGLERVTLKPAHLEQLAVGQDRHLLVAVAPTAGALVVVNPSSCLLAAPGVVLDALGTSTP